MAVAPRRAHGVARGGIVKTYVIADIGACHDGNRRLMDTAIVTAAKIGCDAIKFQWTSDPWRMAARRGRASADGYAAVYALYLDWPSTWHKDLWATCRSENIDYMCTAFLPEDVAVLAPHVAAFKIASFEAADWAIWDAHLPYRDRPIYVSAGMLDDGEAVGAVRARAVEARFNVGLLQCVSSYPAPFDALNLSVLHEFAPMETPVSSRVYAGLSDHTDPRDVWTGALAVAAGARVIEAHLRLDATDPANPDYPHAMTPRQFDAYVRHIRFAETCLGDGVKKIHSSEAAMLPYRVINR